MHTHITEQTPLPGEKYRVSFRGEVLYDATITQAEGCWATLRIDAPLAGKHQALYQVGDEYKIKHAMYSLEKLSVHGE